ncbi:hypothetical protein AR505_0994 [methanogenic archaeon ISO4-H5]|nr:hypothetical protein AR505_0994 [methanogenic archaeon ISO4-H5]
MKPRGSFLLYFPYFLLCGSVPEGLEDFHGPAVGDELVRQFDAVLDVPRLLFVIQMIDVKYFEPARSIDPAFCEALKEAKEARVNILAYICNVTPDSLSLKDPVEVRFP